MTTIVWHRKRQTKYILLGGGFGATKTAMRNTIAGALDPVEEDGQFTYALVSDERGEVFWVDTNQLQVLSVDGQDPASLLED